VRGPVLRWAGLLLALVGVSATVGLTGAEDQLTTAGRNSCPYGSTDTVPVARVDIGGAGGTVDGRAWSADPTVEQASSGRKASKRNLHRSAHRGSFAYEVPVPERGRYVTRLYLTAPEENAEGRRAAISVNVEGGRVELRDFRIDPADAGTPVVKTFTNEVRDGRLTIAGSGRPNLTALEVLRKLPGGECVPEEGAETEQETAVAEDEAAEEKTSRKDREEQAATEQEAAAESATEQATEQVTAAAGAAVGALGVDGGRPWAANSVWNTPIPAGAAVDPKSAAMISGTIGNGKGTANLHEYGESIVASTSSDPVVSVDCTESWGTCDPEKAKLRIPADAQVTPGSDGRLIVTDFAAGRVCDFWQAKKRSSTSWQASWGTCMALDDADGVGPNGGSTGANINALAGVVRTWEIQRGHIPHALTGATNNSCGTFRFPATKSDGSSNASDCIPEGARLQLDPSIDVESIPGITPAEVAIAKALQTYGWINRDNGGARITVQFETLEPGQKDVYGAAGLKWDYWDMPHIPWNKLRVLRG
jgi:hypothetical protein